MNPTEVEVLVKYAGYLKPSLFNGKSKAERDGMASAWAWALDTRMTIDQARRIVTDIVAEGGWIDPGAINDRFLRAIRRPDAPLGRPKLPGGHAEDVIKPDPPKALPSVGQPVKPQDVPEYAEKNQPALRLQALAIECPYCKAPVGRPCKTGTGEPLTKAVAHPSRLQA